MKRLLVLLLLVGVVGCGSDAETQQANSFITNPNASAGNIDESSFGSTSSTSIKVILGTVVGVTDGDTITVLDSDNVIHKIRLKHLDAPESHQGFGTQAKKSLSDKVFNKQVIVEWSEKDRYDRTLGEVFVDDRWINKEIVSDGCAWHYRQYSDDGEIAAAESNAKSKRLGLWAQKNPIAPWDFRRGGRPETRSTDFTAEQAQGTTVFVTRTGKKYHRPNCRFLSETKTAMPINKAKQQYGPCSVCKPQR